MILKEPKMVLLLMVNGLYYKTGLNVLNYVEEDHHINKECVYLL